VFLAIEELDLDLMQLCHLVVLVLLDHMEFEFYREDMRSMMSNRLCMLLKGGRLLVNDDARLTDRDC